MIRKFKKFLCACTVGMLLLFMVSCRPSVPSEYIQPSRLENILYDLHIADGYAINEGGNFDDLASKRQKYREAVLRKYNLTQESFDHSMEYYYRHSDRLQKIYENIAQRLTDDIKSLGGEEYNLSRQYTADGDTANIWQMADSKLLTPIASNNRYEFDIAADTTFHAGDSFILTFRSQYILQDGIRNAVALIAVRLDNDSIMSQTQRINSDADYRLIINLPKDRSAKSVRGFIFMGNGGMNYGQTTLKLLNVYQIALLKIHNKLIIQAPDMQGDSIANDSAGTR